MKTRASLVVHLTGGLGNQLFQIAAGLHASKSKSIAIEWKLGSPRLNKSGFPQIECYEIPPEFNLLGESKNSWLLRKTAGYLLRSSVHPKRLEKIRVFRRFSNFLGSIVLFANFRTFRKVITGNNLGFSPIVIDDSQRHLLGYFQSFRFSEDDKVLRILKSLSVKNFESHKKYIAMADQEEPLIVHVRLTDYREEDKFGIPEIYYYHESVTQLWNTGDYRKIWLFSDEPQNALNRIPENLQGLVRSFGDIENCSAKTLEVMRLGKGYVIANSTFSWWGARLSRSKNPPVITPYPWFRALEEPVDLIPMKWIRKKAW